MKNSSKSLRAMARVSEHHRIPHLKRLTLAIAVALAGPALAVDHDWGSGGFVPGVTAPDPLPATDTLNVLAGGSKSFSSTSWTSEGTVAWQSDTLFGGSATVTNQGLWDSQSDTNTFVYSTGNRPTFINSGEFRKSAGAQTNTGNWQFTNNGGVINALTGVIDFNSATTSFNSGSSFVGDGTTRVSAGAAINGDLTSDNLELAGGNITGTNARLAGGTASSGQVDWSGGALNGSWKLDPGTSMNAISGGTHQLSSASLVNDGDIRWQTNSILFGGSSTLTNNSVFEAQADAGMTWNIGNRPAFENTATGTVRAANGVTFTNNSFGFVNDGGTLEADTNAELIYASGVTTFNDGTQFTGHGRNRVTGSATFNGGYSSENLQIESGNMTASGAIADGRTDWTGGQLRGDWQLSSGHTLRATDGGTKQLLSFALTNDGEILWQSSEDLFGGSGTLKNNHLFEAQTDAGMIWNTGNRPTFENSASGIVRAKDGVTFTNNTFGFVNNGGTLDAGTGAELVFGSGVTAFNDGTQFTGEGVNRVTSSASFAGTYASENLELEGGVLSGNAAVAQGETTWSGGTLSGDWQLSEGHVLSAVDGATKQLLSFALNNAGELLWQTGDTLFAGSGTLTNDALFEAQADAGMTWNIGNRPTFNNTANGTLRATAGVSFINNSLAFVNDGGTLEAVDGGELIFNSGVNSFNEGTNFIGGGTNRVTSSATFSGTYSAENLQLEGVGSFSGSGAVAQGTTTWLGGALRDNWELSDGHTLRAQDGTTKQLISFALTNNGRILWQTADNLFAGSGTLTNNGMIDFQADADVIWNIGNRPALLNTGTIRKSGGTGQTSLAGITLSNLGVIEVQSGTIRLPDNFTNDGLLMGTGSFATNLLTNAGQVAPGTTAPGALTIEGNFVQTTAGVLDIALTDLATLSQLLITGTASLAGDLNLSCFGACSFAVNDEFVILDSVGALDGVFEAVMLSGFRTGAFDVVYDYDLDEVRLLVTDQVSAVPLPAAAWMMLGGLGLLGSIARRRKR